MGKASVDIISRIGTSVASLILLLEYHGNWNTSRIEHPATGILDFGGIPVAK